MDKVTWGVLSTAKIGVEKVIPAMQKGKLSQVRAIASRDTDKAKKAAKKLKIPKAYGSYEQLLADPDIQAVYIPLPNHLHVPWSIEALKAGKHVLCEKPMALNVTEAQQLLDTSKNYPNLKIMEAFMYRHHPQWVRARQLVTQGGLGRLRTIQSFFSYFNTDPENIRNKPDIGGGGLMDIGCYCISLSRFIFGAEPHRVFGIIENDPEMQIDRLTSGILEFEEGTSEFTCSTQLSPYQHASILGTEGSIEVEIPFTPGNDRPCKLWHRKGSDTQEITFATCDQYTIQGDLFSEAILNDTDVPTPLDDAVANMKVIEALIESTKNQTWQKL